MWRTMVVVLVLGAVSGCGDGGGSADSSKGTGDAMRAAALEYATCMRGRGYDIPDPTFDERGVPQFDPPPEIVKRAEYDTDRRACNGPLNRALADAGIAGKPSTAPEALLPFTRCVREQGVPIADPDPVHGLEIDKAIITSPAWPAAVDACRQHLPPGWENIGKVRSR